MWVGEEAWQGGHGAAHAGEAAVDGGHGALEAGQARQARQKGREEVVERPWRAGGPVQQTHGLLVQPQLRLLHLFLATPLGPPVLEPNLPGKVRIRTRYNVTLRTKDMRQNFTLKNQIENKKAHKSLLIISFSYMN